MTTQHTDECAYGWHNTGADGFCKKCGLGTNTDEMREAFEKRYNCTWPYDEYDERASYVWFDAWQACAIRYQDALREAREALDNIARNGAATLGFEDIDKISREALATIYKLLGEKP